MKNPWKRYSKINPQRENGNRQIANDVYQALISGDFLGSEYKLIFAVISKTWGFNKSSDAISIKQFQEMTNLKKRTIQSILKKLKRQRVLYSAPSKVRAQTGSPLNSFLFNKHYDTWKVEGCNITEGCNTEHPLENEKGAKECKTRVQSGSPTKESITKESITKEIYTSNSIEFRLANYLFNNILKNNPNHKKPDLQKWAKTIDLILRIDKRLPNDVKAIIEWCQNDTPDKQPDGDWKGWSSNILSVKSLRVKFDQLFLKMQESTFKPKHDSLTQHNLTVVGKFLKKEGVI